MLQVIRQSLGYTRKELAERLGTTETTIYRWESGRSKPTFTLHQVKALSRELKRVGMKIDDLPDENFCLDSDE